jgi:hypothetical protein
MRTFMLDVPDEVNTWYIEYEGNMCPFCESGDVEVVPWSSPVSMAEVIVCNVCKKEWLECHKITCIMVEHPWEKT